MTENSVAAGDLRVAVIGVGVMGTDHVTRLHRRISGARPVVVSDAFLQKAEEVAAEVPGVRVIEDPIAAIADPEVDAVVIASPGTKHHEQVLACLEHGKPVLCEKPLTTDAASSLEIVRAEEKLGRQLIQVGFMRRFDPEYAALRSLIDSGEIGRALMVHCAHRNPAVPPYFTSEMMINDSVVHEVDVTRFLLGEEIRAVTVLTPTSSSEAPEGLADPMLVLFETESGALVDVELHVTTTIAYEVRTEVVGERGSALIGLDTGLTRSGSGGRRGRQITPGFRERFGTAYDIEFQRWVDAVKHGTIDGPGAWDGYAAAAVCEAGVEALKSGRRTEVSLAEREATSLEPSAR